MINHDFVFLSFLFSIKTVPTSSHVIENLLKIYIDAFVRRAAML